METERLHYVVAASKLLSFSKVAEEYYTSRQAVSLAVREVESELEFPLFERKGNMLILTKPGEDFCLKLDNLLTQLDQLFVNGSQETRDSKQEKLHISISCASNLLAMIDSNEMFPLSRPYSGLADLIDEYAQKHDATVDINEHPCSTCADNIKDGTSDIAIIYCQRNEFPYCEKWTLAKEPLGVMMSSTNPLASRDSFTVSDLRDLPLCFNSDYDYAYREIKEACYREGFELKPVAKHENDQLTKKLIVLDRYMALVTNPDNYTPPDGTTIVPVDCPGIFWYLMLIYSKQSPKIKQLRSFARSIVNSHKLNES